MTAARTFALIPAAGRSRRMGRPKLLLPLGERTVLEWVLHAFRTAAVEHVLVVVPPEAAELARTAEQAGAHVLRLDEQTPDMRATLEHGLTWLEERFRPAAADGWFLSPADHPTLDPAVIGRLLAAREAHPTATIFIPGFEGRRGHPALIGWGHVAGIRAWPAGEGLNTYLRTHTGETLLVPAPSADVLIDLDTPDDYARLLRRPW